MRKTLYIFLSLLLTVAVTDHLWFELLTEDQSVAQIEMEEEAREELRESKPHENRLDGRDFDWYGLPTNIAVIDAPRFVIQSLSPRLAESLETTTKLFILYSDLKLDC